MIELAKKNNQKPKTKQQTKNHITEKNEKKNASQENGP